MATVAFLLAVVSGCNHRPADEVEAIAAIQRLGGQVKYDPQRNVVEVALGGTPVSQAELARLPAFAELKTLSVFDSPIGDDDLEPLRGLTKLETLYLGRTRITDAGLKHLAHLNTLKTLGLSDTEVSDQGLKQLASLADLRSINVRRRSARREIGPIVASLANHV